MSYLRRRLRLLGDGRRDKKFLVSKRVFRYRLEHWKQILGDVKGETLNDRLQLIGLQAGSKAVRLMLSQQDGTVQSLAKHFHLRPSEALPVPAPIRSSIGGTLCWQMAVKSVAMLRDEFTSFGTQVGSAAIPSMVRGLCGHILNLSTPVLKHEYETWKAAVPSSTPASFNQVLAKEGEDLIDRHYPALSILLCETLRTWRHRWRLMLERLSADRRLIEKNLFPNGCIGKVVSVSDFLSDMHAGQCTVAFEFENGLPLIYKPKDFSPDVFFHKIIAFHNKTCSCPTLRGAKVIRRSGYGWAEFVEYTRVLSRSDISLFWERCGALLFYLYVVDATDAHQFNVICSHAHPCLVDSECILHQRELADSIRASRFDDLSRSVLRTGLLPSVRVNKFNEAHEWGGFVPGLKRAQNMPGGARGLEVTRNLYSAENGFRIAYENALRHRRELLEIVATADRIRSRYVLRATNYYDQVLRLSLSPHSSRDRIDRALEFEYLARLYVHPALRLPAPLFERELIALERGEVPIFHSYSNSRHLYQGGRKIVHEFFGQESTKTVLDRIQELSVEDLEFQLSIIRSCVGLRRVTFTSRGKPVPLRGRPIRGTDLIPASTGAAISQSEALAYSVKIGDYLVERATPSNKGLGWIVPRFNPVAQVFSLGGLDAGLYQGRAGIALFFAGLYSATTEQRFLHATYATLDPLLDIIHRNSSRLRPSGVSGAASIAYTLGRIGILLNDERIKGAVKTAWDGVDLRRTQTDENPDLMSGAAGVLLAAEGCSSMLPDPLQEQAVSRCGSKLLTASSGDSFQCKTICPQPLTGLSHGASGIALAFCSLYKRTGERKYLQHACRALDFEESAFNLTCSNWPDLRYRPYGSVFQSAWCHGSSGIGLSRIGMEGAIARARLQCDVERAVVSVKRSKLLRLDQLCCGTTSQIVFLVEAAEFLNDESLVGVAKELAAEMIRRARRNQGFSFAAKPDRLLSCPSLFTGIAGVGYGLLLLSQGTHAGLPRPWLLR